VRRSAASEHGAGLTRTAGAPPSAAAAVTDRVSVGDAATLPVDRVLGMLGSGGNGLTESAAAARRARVGANAVRSRQVSAWVVLRRQLRSALLGLLAGAALVSFFVGERADAVVIAVILGLSVGFGFVNEYRAERAGVALHDRIRHTAVVTRDGTARTVDVTTLVPGDLVQLELGMVVPADMRLLSVELLECDESVLTGESAAVVKSGESVPPGTPLAELASCALMGTVVHRGRGSGVVVATGMATAFGAIAAGLGQQQPETEFQVGLRRFSVMLSWVAGILTTIIFVINVLLQRPLLDAILFSLAIAVGITPQLLPAVVTTSLAVGSRALAARRVLVKRLVCVEDIGNVQVLFTDKTGTLTEGRISLRAAYGTDGNPDERALLLGLLANEAVLHAGVAVGGEPLDVATWQAPGAATAPVGDYRRVASLPFDHERRRVSVLVDGPDGRMLVSKGAPEQLLALCPAVPDGARAVLDRELAAGGRVVALATRPAPGVAALSVDDERDLTFAGLLVFLDTPKASARAALQRLAGLGVAVKVITGDHPAVARHVCAELGLDSGGVLTGADLAQLDDEALRAALATTAVFARVSPQDKARIVRAQRTAGADVAFLGDGVNDALALHTADVGISVDSATDVAKDAADILLLDKDLDVLADGVTEGRRIFANTIKYVLMATSSNFGNMFSAAGASAFLTFLPMLPSQILLNNLIYDTTQLAIPTDHADAEQLARPAHWDLHQIRRFMLTFGPLSSLFDFLTFAILLQVLHAGPVEFRSGWFVESMATQILVVFVIRTHRTPFWRSRPSRALIGAALCGVVLSSALPYLPVAGPLGFTALPPAYLLAVAVLAAAYLALVDTAKRWVMTPTDLLHAAPVKAGTPRHRIRRRAARFTPPARI
jgi:P-type Mg2+ transporter